MLLLLFPQTLLALSSSTHAAAAAKKYLAGTHFIRAVGHFTGINTVNIPGAVVGEEVLSLPPAVSPGGSKRFYLTWDGRL